LAAAVAEVLSDVKDEDLAEVVETVLAAITDETDPEDLTDEDKEKIVAVVAAVVENGVTAEVAQTLASSPAVLESVTTEQAEAVFEQVDAGELTDEVAEQIVEAVQEAPSEIRETFEDVVDLFEGAFDSYKMLGQTVTVGERRTVAAVAALATATGATMAAGAAGGRTSPPGGDTPGPSSPGGSNDAARKNDEEEEEAAGELAGDGVEWIKNIRIFRYEHGVKILDWKAFLKKFAYGIFNSGWTISGAVILFLTLSGTLQVIAGVASAIALSMAMYLHMKEPE